MNDSIIPEIFVSINIKKSVEMNGQFFNTYSTDSNEQSLKTKL